MTLASFFAMLAFFLMRSFLFVGIFGGGRNRDSGGGSIWMVYLVSMLVYFVSQILILALGRYRELSADRRGAYLTRRPRDLASALRKIAGSMPHTNQQTKQAVQSMNAFFIVPTSLKELFSSHPPLERRIRELEKIERELGGAA
jgi:heat shock protein HtpX